MGGYDGRRGWVYRMVVTPEARRLGVARRLVEELEQRMRAAGVAKMSLLVMAGNGTAMDFWAAVGFDPVPEVRYFSKPLIAASTSGAGVPRQAARRPGASPEAACGPGVPQQAMDGSGGPRTQGSVGT